MAITHHINRLKEKPSHVRERVAFATAGGVTGLVALAWVAAMATSGAFSLAPIQVAESAVGTGADVKAAVVEGKSNFSQLLGAAGAATGLAPQDPALEITDVRTTSTFESTQAASGQTVINF